MVLPAVPAGLAPAVRAPVGVAVVAAPRWVAVPARTCPGPALAAVPVAAAVVRVDLSAHPVVERVVVAGAVKSSSR